MDLGESDNKAGEERDGAEVVIVTADRSSTRSAAGSSARPELGVGHLLLWVGCCGVFLGLARAMAERPAGLLGAAMLTLVAAGYGAAWAGMVVTLARTFRGAPWSIEPGQWLLTLLGAVTAVETLGEVASPHWLRDPRGIVLAAAVCAFFAPLFDMRLPPRWKWLFGAVSLLYALPLLTALGGGQPQMPMPLARAVAALTPRTLVAATAAGAVMLSCFDVGRRFTRSGRDEPRGWLHWTGIAAAVWLALLPWAMSRLMGA